MVERAKFSSHITVSAGFSYEGNGCLHFIDEKAKVNAKYYVENLLPKLVKDCPTVVESSSFLTRLSALSLYKAGPRLVSKSLSKFHRQGCKAAKFSRYESTRLYMPIWGAMRETYNKLTTKPTNIPDLKDTLQIIWKDFT